FRRGRQRGDRAHAGAARPAPEQRRRPRAGLRGAARRPARARRAARRRPGPRPLGRRGARRPGPAPMGRPPPGRARALPTSPPAAALGVAAVSATAALYRREALEAVAPQGQVFEDAFFAYYEDVDLSLRLARAGWRFACDPSAVARHEGSRTGRRTPWRRAVW